MKAHVRAERMTHRPENALYKHLRVDGDPAGSPDMCVDGSVTPVLFQYIVPAGKRVIIERVLFTGLGPTIKPERFVSIAAVTNGLTIDILDPDDNSLLDFLDGHGITANYKWAQMVGVDVPSMLSPGSALDMMPLRWTLGKSGWATELLAGEKFSVGVHDDLTAIDYLEMFLQGHIEDTE